MSSLNKNIDGIIKQAQPQITHKPRYAAPVVVSRVTHKRPAFFRLKQKNVYIGLAVFALAAAFTGGMMTALKTPRSQAETEAAASAPANKPIAFDNVEIVTPSDTVSGDVLFNTPIEMLQDFLSPKATPDVIGERAAKLTAYLKTWNSPFAEEADVIARQDHWKLILAISFAESTLGKRCYYNNCSGIGGSNIRTYKSLENWILDFNRLLEKRYKNQTLEQMCGVYVQPCNKNWLLATKQILDDLKAEGIE